MSSRLSIFPTAQPPATYRGLNERSNYSLISGREAAFNRGLPQRSYEVMMMLLMAVGTIPFSSVADYATVMIEESTKGPFPGYARRDVYYQFGDDGIIEYIIVDVEKGHEDEALRLMRELLFRLGTSVKGVRWRVEQVFSLDEALEMISKAIP